MTDNTVASLSKVLDMVEFTLRIAKHNKSVMLAKLNEIDERIKRFDRYVSPLRNRLRNEAIVSGNRTSSG